MYNASWRLTKRYLTQGGNTNMAPQNLFGPLTVKIERLYFLTLWGSYIPPPPCRFVLEKEVLFDEQVNQKIVLEILTGLQKYVVNCLSNKYY